MNNFFREVNKINLKFLILGRSSQKVGEILGKLKTPRQKGWDYLKLVLSSFLYESNKGENKEQTNIDSRIKYGVNK